jgi:pantoate--beta-alanine ligase
MMIVAHTREELAAARAKLAVPHSGEPYPGEPHPGGPLVLVPTMGALHDGHRALLRRARELAGESGITAASIFVNPLQFGPGEDLDRYPRTLPDDLAIAEAEGVDLVFAPSVDDMYPRQQVVLVDPGPLGDFLEGAYRPGHFQGVLTVVLKLFMLVRPDIGVFGQKDAQQLAVIRRMAEDFALGIKIEGVPTVREAGGLALSSRNKYLSSSERPVATALSRALCAGAAAAPRGPGAVLAAARQVLDAAGKSAAGVGLDVDYVELADWENARGVRDDDGFIGTATLAIAARVGTTRLIDNVPVRFDAAHD